MKCLLDESVDFPLAAFLRNLDFEVKTIVETEPSIDDKDVLVLANQENRILITNDKDFGELVFKNSLPHKGVVLLRLEEESSQAKVGRLKVVLDRYKYRLPNNFLVVTENKIRINEF